METPEQTLRGVLQTIENAAKLAGRPRGSRLLAVSKTRPPEAVRDLASAGQRAFGENYVQEGIAKIRALSGLGLEWHLIGHLQSNKCREAAEHFDWVQTVDREKIVPLLAQYRPASKAPLNVLIQVNIDDEHSKSGCRPEDVDALAGTIMALGSLTLRGLMAIPDPATSGNGLAFAQMQRLFRELRGTYPTMDTLSMGMSDDFPVAIAEGATLVRIGTALFGPRGQ